MADSVALPFSRPVARFGAWWDRLDGSIVFIYALVVVVGIGAGLYSERFRDPNNLSNVLRQTIVLGLLSIGQSLVILAGGIDMSIALIGRFATLIVAVMFGGDEGLIVPLLALGLATGAALGLLNGFIITRVYASPFIVTFGMFSILNGVCLAIASSPVGKIPAGYLTLYDARFGPLPTCVLVMAVVWVTAWVLTSRTRFGRALYAVGGSPRVARLAAIDVSGTLRWAYVLSGLCGAAGGLFILARSGVGDPKMADGLEFQSIVAVALGGISLSGGRGTIVGTLGGVLLLGVVANMFNILQVDAFLQQLILGLVVLITVATYRTAKTT
ncbi:MAG TPA: ABC transporter permease [Chloroflexota bacterium]|nr:ABC transporter permease [Chloroflexota bacterium]